MVAEEGRGSAELVEVASKVAVAVSKVAVEDVEAEVDVEGESKQHPARRTSIINWMPTCPRQNPPWMLNWISTWPRLVLMIELSVKSE